MGRWEDEAKLETSQIMGMESRNEILPGLMRLSSFRRPRFVGGEVSGNPDIYGRNLRFCWYLLNVFFWQFSHLEHYHIAYRDFPSWILGPRYL